MKRGKQLCSVRKERSSKEGSNELKLKRRRRGPIKAASLNAKKKRLQSKSTPRPQSDKAPEVEMNEEICENREINKETRARGVLSTRAMRDEVRQVKRPLRRKPQIFYLRTAVCRRTPLSYTGTVSESEVPPAPATPSLGPNQTGEILKVPSRHFFL